MNNMTTTPNLAELATRAEPPPSDKQLAFIERLLSERPSFPAEPPRTKRQASELIDTLLLTPKEKNLNAGGDRTVQALLRDVPDGFYALESRTGTNDLDFIVVVTRRGSKRYVNRYLGGQGQVHLRSSEQRAFAQRLSELDTTQLHVLRTLFGIELGRCCRCGRELTDETSRALGIGPECRSKL